MMYICEEHAAATEGPGVVNGIQLVMMPLLISRGRVVVITVLEFVKSGKEKGNLGLLSPSLNKRMWASSIFHVTHLPLFRGGDSRKINSFIMRRLCVT